VVIQRRRRDPELRSERPRRERCWRQLRDDRHPQRSRDLAQAVLVSHLDMIGAVLDFLGVPHDNGFFAKDIDPKPHFTPGWEDRVLEKFRTVFPEPLLLFYINHLRWELLSASDVYRPAA